MSQEPTSIGRYQVQSLLGRGGMGAVYLVEDPKLKRLLVIKIVHEGGRHYAHAMERFQREAEISARLNHPNIITVHDVGEDPQWGPFIAMEYVKGTSLAALIHDQTSAQEALLHVLTQSARGLMAAAMAGIVHRDVKPENILVGHDGRVKVMDFGVARTRESQQLTTIGGIIGTPSYFAPELLKDAEASPASDCYALAVTAFEALTGTLPFQGDSVASTLLRIVNEPPAIPADMEPAMRAVFVKAFAKIPKDRFPDVYAFMGALVDAAPVGENTKSKLHSAMEGTEVSLTGLEPGRSPRFTPSRPTGRPTLQPAKTPAETAAPATASAPVVAIPPVKPQPEPYLSHPEFPEPMAPPPRQGNSQLFGLVFAGIGALIMTGAGFFGWRWWRSRLPVVPPTLASADSTASTAPPPSTSGELSSTAGTSVAAAAATAPKSADAPKPSLSQLQQQLKDLQERNAREAEKLRQAKGGAQPVTSAVSEPPRPAPPPPNPTQAQSDPPPAHVPQQESQPTVPPRLIFQAAATFPRRARDLRFETGKDHLVRLRVTVDEQGRPVVVSLLEGVPGVFGFNEEASSAAQRSRYAPATKGGRPVRETMDVVYQFKASK